MSDTFAVAETLGPPYTVDTLTPEERRWCDDLAWHRQQRTRRRRDVRQARAAYLGTLAGFPPIAYYAPTRLVVLVGLVIIPAAVVAFALRSGARVRAWERHDSTCVQREHEEKP